jgi:hypothetical protein
VAGHDKTTQGRMRTNVRPGEKRLPLWRDMTKLRRVGYELRFRYVKLVVVLVGTQACLATVCVSRRRDVRYASGRFLGLELKVEISSKISHGIVRRMTLSTLHAARLPMGL